MMAMPLDIVVTYTDGDQELFYAPLESMRGIKPAEPRPGPPVLADPADRAVVTKGWSTCKCKNSNQELHSLTRTPHPPSTHWEASFRSWLVSLKAPPRNRRCGSDFADRPSWSSARRRKSKPAFQKSKCETFCAPFPPSLYRDKQGNGRNLIVRCPLLSIF